MPQKRQFAAAYFAIPLSLRFQQQSEAKQLALSPVERSESGKHLIVGRTFHCDALDKVHIYPYTLYIETFQCFMLLDYDCDLKRFKYYCSEACLVRQACLWGG